ncbi:MAG: hypothetical protein NDJ72_09445 [Elusimicrobia bacterium]|nr:hypothetical protein [Elusimicrobiota bacterium]
MRAAVSLVLAFVLGLSPAAQAQVVSGRAAALPSGGLGLAPLSSPRLTVPSASFSALIAPGLGATLAAPAPAPVPFAVMAAPVSAVRPVPAAAALIPLRAAAASLPSAPTPEKARAVRARFDELKAAFDEKGSEDVAAAPGGPAAPLPPAEIEGAKTSQEPPKPPSQPRGKTYFGFTKPLAFFLLALVLAQVGIEAQNAGLPPLIAKVFGSASVVADVGMTAALAELVGTIAAPIVAKKLGLKGAYVWSTGLRVATGGLIAGLLAAGWLSLGGLVALFAVDAVLLGVSLITEKSIPAVLLDQNQRKLEHFKAARQTAIEVVATIVPIATGALVAAVGFIPALVAFPVAMSVSIGLVALTLKFPGKVSGLDGQGLPGPGEGSLLTYFRHLRDGALEIARTPTLLLSVLSYSLVYVPISLVYWFMAPAFALHVAGAGNEALAAAYGGMMIGLYSLGGIVAGLWTMRQQRRERDAAAMRTSMLRWTVACALGLTLFASMAIPVGAIWGSLTLPALALFLFGIPQVTAKLKLESFFQSRAPKGKVDDATAVLESASSIAIVLGLWLFGKVLAGAGIASLPLLSLVIGPIIALLLLLTWALARASKPAVAP